MFAKVKTASYEGLNTHKIDVEVDISNGLPSIQIVGLPDKMVQEAKHRVSSAIINSGYKLPPKRIIINLSPGNLDKAGTHFDLPIALGILRASRQISQYSTKRFYFGELSLNGSLRIIKGAIPLLNWCNSKNESAVIPESNRQDSDMFPKADIFLSKNLKKTVEGEFETRTLIKQINNIPNQKTPTFDMCHVKGNIEAKRALEIAAAGGHNILLTGSPGSGKSMLSRAFQSILPPLTDKELLEVAMIYSVAGLKLPNLTDSRPYRSPHHSLSLSALVGGGTVPKPGEISLAHNGVLFLDELPEFSLKALDSLRQPLEDKELTISRTKTSLSFPANIILVGAMNPCRCGYLLDPNRECMCSPSEVDRYRKRISGPIQDRIDLHITVNGTSYEELRQSSQPEKSESIRTRVINATKMQRKRYANHSILRNDELNHTSIELFVDITPQAENLLESASKQYRLTTRATLKIIKIAQTIADLSNEHAIRDEYIGEALRYRFQT